MLSLPDDDLQIRSEQVSLIGGSPGDDRLLQEKGLVMNSSSVTARLFSRVAEVRSALPHEDDVCGSTHLYRNLTGLGFFLLYSLRRKAPAIVKPGFRFFLIWRGIPALGGSMTA